jgi:hypothetical protein
MGSCSFSCVIFKSLPRQISQNSKEMKKKSNKFLPYIIALAVILIIVLVVGKKQGWFGKDFEINVAT